MAGKNLTEVTLSVEDNKRMITQMMKTFTAPPINLNDPEAVERRIAEYFASCAESGLRPGNLGMYSALGLTKQDVNNALHERSHKLNPAVIDSIKRGILAMSSYREMLCNHGKLNPVSYIFQSKNFDGLTDQAQLQVTRADDFGKPRMTPDQIDAYLHDIERRIPNYKQEELEAGTAYQKMIEQDIPVD